MSQMEQVLEEVPEMKVDKGKAAGQQGLSEEKTPVRTRSGRAAKPKRWE
jgi:hypothetical protein